MSRSIATPLLTRRFWTSFRASGEASSNAGLWSRSPGRTTSARGFANSASTARRGARALPGQGGHTVKKSGLTGGGLLLLGLDSSSASSPAIAASCAAAADSSLLVGASHKLGIYRDAREAWQRSLHTAARRGIHSVRREHTDSKPGSDSPAKTTPPPPPKQEPSTIPKPEHHGGTPVEPESIASSVSKYFHLPTHRPTKEELLAAANGFWERLKVRFKWVSIRSMRPWNIDEWGAFVSWFLFGHLVWILVGTTTFFSILVFSINTVFAQETLAKWIGDYLTHSAGLTVVFESAIVPKWKDGVISFRNVFVSQRPGQVKSSVSKGSSTNAAAVAAAGRQSETGAQVAEEDDGNYTQFDVTIAAVNVTLSFLKWWNGKGLLKDVEVRGVRGVVDRTSVHSSSEVVDPLSYRHTHAPGDFEIDSFKLEDLLVTVHQPGGFRPFSVSIYTCELPRLRKQWLFYDFLSASHTSGSFDGSLFTIHPRQVHSSVPANTAQVVDGLGDHSVWKKFSRLRIDGLKIDHLNRGVDGPFGWIYEGNVDIVADVVFPTDAEEGIGKVVSELYDQLEEVVNTNSLKLLNEARLELGLPLPTPSPEQEIKSTLENKAPNWDEERRFLIMDLRIHLNDVKAAVPLFTREISYINQALVRPIVAYINAGRTYIPISCRIVKLTSDFDGSWTVFDCGLMNDLSAETYEAFARDVEDQQSRVRRLRKVGFWTLSLAVHALFMGMAGNVI